MQFPQEICILSPRNKGKQRFVRSFVPKFYEFFRPRRKLRTQPESSICFLLWRQFPFFGIASADRSAIDAFPQSLAENARRIWRCGGSSNSLSRAYRRKEERSLASERNDRCLRRTCVGCRLCRVSSSLFPSHLCTLTWLCSTHTHTHTHTHTDSTVSLASSCVSSFS